MDEETQDKIHEGYLITGEQKNVDGGSTVDFKKRNKVYFILWKRGNHIYNLEGFENESKVKGRRKSSINVFGGRRKSLSSSKIPSHMLTSRVNVHCMDMKIGRKTNHVIILIHAKIPYYFKTLKEEDIKPWYEAFSRVSKDMETRNTDRKPSEDVVLRDKNPNHNSTASRDSGRSSADASSVRWSQGSSGSWNSDTISSCPPSPSFIPNNIRFEMDETEDHGEDDDEDHITSLSSAQKARRTLTNSVIYKSVERSNSPGGSKKKYEYTEASAKVYDAVIRTSFIVDDDDNDNFPPSFPQKRRGRRGSEPNLQVPDVFRDRHTQGHSPNPVREITSDWPSPPPPLVQERNPSFNYSNVNSEPLYEKCKVKEDIGRLMWEQSKVADGIVVEFSKAELLDSLILITINNEVWVAGWKKDLNSQLYGKLHVGDKLHLINSQVVTSAELALEIIRTTAIDEIKVTLYRLPHAYLLNLNRSDHNIQWGIHLKSHIEIKSLTDGPAITEGLKAKASFSGKPCDWVITEINLQRVPLVRNGKNQDLVKAELEADHSEVPLVVQPHDFIKKLAEAVERRRGSQFY